MTDIDRFSKLLLSTKRQGMRDLLIDMEKGGFFTAPCSSKFHLCKEGGLLEHSLNVYDTMKELAESLTVGAEITDENIIICALLHDLGKMGQFGKPNYVENILKTGISKAQPYKTNPDLLYIPHEIRSISIAKEHIALTEQEEFAILYHNGLYGDLKYAYNGKETELSMLLHMADLWCCRVTEVDDEQ